MLRRRSRRHGRWSERRARTRGAIVIAELPVDMSELRQRDGVRSRARVRVCLPTRLRFVGRPRRSWRASLVLAMLVMPRCNAAQRCRACGSGGAGWCGTVCSVRATREPSRMREVGSICERSARIGLRSVGAAEENAASRAGAAWFHSAMDAMVSLDLAASRSDGTRKTPP